MARRNRFTHKRQTHRARPAQAATLRAAPVAIEKKPPIRYGDPFILLEDESKKTFEYKAGQWVPYSMSIAECRQSCQVNELPQKVKDMTRYEIRCAVPAN